MHKITKKLSLVMVALLTVFTALSYMPAKAAVVVPKVQYVSAPQLEYTAGDRVQFNLNAPNYGGRVQYRVVLWDNNNKVMKDLWTTGDRYYTNWQPYGNETFTLGWPISEPGTYRITIYAKRAGLANNKTALTGYNCDSYMESAAFVVKAKTAPVATVESIGAIADVNVDQFKTPVLPTDVTLNMSDKTTKTAKVTWGTVDTTKVGTVNVEGTVEGTDKKATVKVTVKEVLTAVESVIANSSKSLQVTFNKAVDTTKTTFTVKRANTTVVLTASFDATKKIATLTASTKLVAGDYTVTAAGETYAAGKNVGTVTVTAEKVAKIEITSDKLVKSAADAGTVGYKVYNQYNEDVTKETVAQNLVWTASIATDSSTPSDANNGIVTVDKTGNFAVSETFVLTAIDPATATTERKTLTVVDKANVSNIVFGTIVLPTNKTRVYTGTASAADVPVVVTDEYGNEAATAAGISAAVTVVSSESTASASFVDVNSKPYLRLNTSAMTAAKSVTMTILVNSTGATFKYTFDVVAASAPAEVAVTAPSDTIAASDVSGDLVIPISVKDQFGTDLTVDQIAANVSKFTITSSNSGVIASNQLAIATSGDDKGKIVNTAAIGATAGTTTITVTVNATGKSSSFVLTTRAARELTTISVPSTLSANMIQGATQAFKLSYKDQYGADFDATADIAGHKVSVVIATVSGDAAGLTILPTGDVADESTLDTTDALTLTAVAGKVGTYTLTIKYVDTVSSEVLSQEVRTINVVKNSAANLTYSISDIPTIYSDATYLGAGNNTLDAAVVSTGYAKELKIVATDASGATYVIPASAIVGVEVDNTAVATVANVAGKWYIAGGDTNADHDTLTEDTTVKLSIIVNTEEGIKVLTKNVVVSKDALKAASVKLLDKVITDTTAKAISSLTFTNIAGLKTGSAVFAYVVDQFGGTTLSVPAGVIVSNSGLTLTDVADVVGITANNFALTDADDNSTNTAGATFRYVIYTSTGAYGSIDVTIEN